MALPKQIVVSLVCFVIEGRNTVQALKYLSAHAVTIYMPGFKAINWK